MDHITEAEIYQGNQQLSVVFLISTLHVRLSKIYPLDHFEALSLKILGLLMKI